MILSRTSKYGLQAVLYLARHDDGPVLSTAIAKRLHIPPHFLAKILQDLARRGVLQSFKGRGGGFQLARPADEIRLLEVVGIIEGREFEDSCVLGLRSCSELEACPLHHHWKAIKGQILQMLSDESVKGLLTGMAPDCLLVRIDPSDVEDE